MPFETIITNLKACLHQRAELRTESSNVTNSYVWTMKTSLPSANRADWQTIRDSAYCVGFSAKHKGICNDMWTGWTTIYYVRPNVQDMYKWENASKHSFCGSVNCSAHSCRNTLMQQIRTCGQWKQVHPAWTELIGKPFRVNHIFLVFLPNMKRFAMACGPPFIRFIRSSWYVQTRDCQGTFVLWFGLLLGSLVYAHL